ncbi:MAG TPA: chemotaxis protein CheW [Thermoanaerobaculia bacterium]
MVDLAKIRKKAKKQKEEAAGTATGPATPEMAPAAETKGHDSAAARTPDPETEVVSLAVSQHPATPAPGAAAIESGVSSSKLDRFKAEAGRRREQETVEKVEETGERVELLTFVIAKEQYAVDIERIVEIVTPRPVTRVPNADPSIVGIISLRGTIVTLVDVRRKLGHPPAGAHDEETRIVVVDLSGEMIGFIVDRVLRVVKTSPDAIEAHPVVHAAELDESVRGVFRAGDALTIVLELDKLLDHSNIASATA